MATGLTAILEALSFLSLGLEKIWAGYPSILTVILCIATGVLMLLGR